MQIAALIEGPQDLMPLLRIIDEKGQYAPFSSPFPEQVEIFEALQTYPEVYIIKPRQIGCSTVCRAHDFIYGYTCPDPANSLIVSHEGDSTHKMHRMNTDYLDGLEALDSRFSREIKASNRKELILKDTGFTWRCVTAGGRGAGKSFTYQRGHFTEVGSWDKACDAKELWTSLRATMHKGPHYQMIAESTGHGPGTLWEDLVYAALRSKHAHVVFSKWSNHPAYRTKAPPDFDNDLSSEEVRLMRVHGLDLDQLYWRRLKIDESNDPVQFRHNYPLTIQDAFMADSGFYFDADSLNMSLAVAQDIKPLGSRNGLTVFARPVPKMQYTIGVDSSSGVGKDYAAVQVLSSDHEQVAVYHSNRCVPDALAEVAAELGKTYNDAMILAEEKGKQGGVCLRRLRELGYPERSLWCDEQGKDWDTNFANKTNAFNYARRLINNEAVLLNDTNTIHELIQIQQKENGSIEAPPRKHDDLADALVFALWAMRDIDKGMFWTPSKRQVLKRHIKSLPAHPWGN